MQYASEGFREPRRDQSVRDRTLLGGGSRSKVLLTRPVQWAGLAPASFTPACPPPVDQVPKFKSLGRHTNAAVLCGIAGSATEQIENDLLVAAQVEGDLLRGLILLAGHPDGDLLPAIAAAV